MSPRKRTTTTYLSTAEFAERVGVKPDTLYGYALPEPDAMIGTTRGWLPATVDTWNESRPGRGQWGKRSTSPVTGRNRAAEILESALGVTVVGDGR